MKMKKQKKMTKNNNKQRMMKTDAVDPSDVPDLEEELGIQHNGAQIQEKKKLLFQLFLNVDTDDKQAVIAAIRKSNQQI
ncbi:unnamed protein product [Paramecium octaurelia]|uniref:Uncharacterized protein n=1 Tax=Paramecium octaurelia TaxID=43137 RepID=A0A8S1X9Y8_PAROT|nr:unnamed protein product [Paramecium octaurelia]